MTLKKNYALSLLVGAALLSSCSSDSGSSTTSSSSSSTTSANVSSLTQVPNTSSMVTQNSSSAALVRSLKAVTGTPPLLRDISSSNVDTYFWNGLISTISNAGTATADQRNQFWGGVNGGPGGEGACRMAQSVGFGFQQVLSAGTSLCYMKNFPTASSGVTVSSGTASEIFSPTAADKVVRVDITENGSTAQNIFIRVVGTNTTGGTSYKVVLNGCQNGTGTFYEDISVNKSTGLFTASHESSSDNGTMSFSSVITASLTTDASGNITFDPSADRNAIFHVLGSNFSYKSDVTLNSSNQIITKAYETFTGNGSSTRRIYSIAGFSGSSLGTLRFTEAGFIGEDNFNGESYSYTGGLEFQTTHYAVNTSNSLATTAGAFSMNNDSFYGPASPSTSNRSAIDCNQTADLTVSLNMDDAGVQAVTSGCEAFLSNMNFCDSTTINSARQIIYSSN